MTILLNSILKLTKLLKILASSKNNSDVLVFEKKNDNKVSEFNISNRKFVKKSGKSKVQNGLSIKNWLN